MKAAALQIFLDGPAASFYAEQIKTWWPGEIMNGRPTSAGTTASLVIHEPRKLIFDWAYFLAFTKIFPAHILQAGYWQLNQGLPGAQLTWPELDKEGPVPAAANGRDGIFAAEIYYVPAGLKLPADKGAPGVPTKIIPTPVMWPASTLAAWPAPRPVTGEHVSPFFKYAPTAQAAEAFTRPLLLLDRDGVLNEDGHYPAAPRDIKLRPAILPVLRYAQEKQALLVVLSNQSGIARGKFTPADLDQVTQYLQDLLAKEGIALAAWYACPFYPAPAREGAAPGAPYQVASLLRKPFPAMALLAAADLGGNLLNSVMVGDKSSDAIYALVHNFWLAVNPEHAAVAAPASSPGPSYAPARQVFSEEALLDALKKIWP